MKDLIRLTDITTTEDIRDVMGYLDHWAAREEKKSLQM